MDNDNPVPPTPAPAPQVAPATIDRKMILWLIIGVVLVFVAVGGIYWYLSNKQTAQNTAVPRTTVKSPVPETNLNDELNSIDVTASGSSEFKAVDSDISGL